MKPSPAKAVQPAKKKSEPQGPTIQQFCDAVVGASKKDDGPKVSRTEAAMALWNYALRGSKEREEIAKFSPVSGLIAMLDKGSPEEQYTAIGCLCGFAPQEKLAAELFTPKVLNLSINTLQSTHFRTRLPAVQLLSLAAARPDLVQRVSDYGLLPLFNLLANPGPAWAQLRQTQLHAVTAIRTVIEKVGFEPHETRQARRLQLINAHAIPVLVAFVNYTPRMPVAATIPAPLPAMPKKPTAKAKKASVKEITPLGCRDAIATQAASCLRYLALCPEFIDELLASASLASFVGALQTANTEQSAFISGVLWEICSERDVAAQVGAARGVQGLLHVISCNYLAAFLKGGPPKKKAPEKESNKKSSSSNAAKDKEVVELPYFPLIAICNATGALNHLTFIDEVKREVANSGGIPILTACLRLKDPHIYENSVGALWNVGLDAHNEAALRSVNVPEFLAKPVPEGWTVDEGVQDDAAGEDDPAPFLTS